MAPTCTGGLLEVGVAQRDPPRLNALGCEANRRSGIPPTPPHFLFVSSPVLSVHCVSTNASQIILILS